MSVFGPVATQVEDGIGVMILDNPPVNALGHAMRVGLLQALDALETDATVRLILIGGAGETFPAGADIREFEAPLEAPLLPDVFVRFEACKKPVIAALHGSILGGGLELALAAHYRIAHVDAKLGFPEVTLGLLPGAGGTQRAPRLIGAGPALDMMTSGKPVTAARAHAMGLVDRLAEEDLTHDALSFAQELLADKSGPRPTSERTEGFADPATNWAALRKHHDAANRLPEVLIAPRKIVHCVESAQMLPFAQGMVLEREEFDDCLASAQSVALRYAFFAQRAAAKPPEGTPAPRDLNTIAVIGAGIMGAMIALRLARAGYLVRLVDRNSAALKAGNTAIYERLDALVARGEIGVRDRAALVETIKMSTDLRVVEDADMVIETVVEDFDIKSELFFKLGQITREDTILATNSSFLDVEGLAPKSGRPEAIIGLHFAGPFARQTLLEIGPALATSKDIIASGFALAKALGMTPVLVNSSEGYVSTRMTAAYHKAADFLLEDGANPAEIDAAMRELGFPTGPYQDLDRTGLDVVQARRRAEAATRDPDDRYVDISDRLCARGWFGQKSGRGYYRYPEGSKVPVECEEVAALIDIAREEKGITPKPYSSAEIAERCVLAMVNEGARLVGEHAVARPSDIDAAVIQGIGFPRWLGGPMYQGDLISMTILAERLDMMSMEAPEFWSPAALILQLGDDERRFADLNTDRS